MNHYVDITVMPDPEFTATALMNALFSKCHRLLGQRSEGKLGVSFPGIGKTLGSTLRLHGLEADLEQVVREQWLKGLNDYVKVGSLSEVPPTACHRRVFRARVKSAHNVRTRSVSKGWMTESEAMDRYPDGSGKRLTLPFVQVKSLSNKNSFKVFIGMSECQTTPISGSYTSYGLSKSATIPWF